MKSLLAGLIAATALAASSTAFADEIDIVWNSAGDIEVSEAVRMLPLPPQRPLVSAAPVVRSATPARVVRVAQTEPVKRPLTIWLSMGSGF